MKLHWGFFLAVFVAAMPSHAAASAIYSVNLVTTPIAGGGTETFTGTITTDGTLGALSASNFVDWAITGSGPFSISVSQALGGSVSCGPSGCGVTATSTELDLTGSGGFTFENFSGLINMTVWQIGFGGGGGFGYPQIIEAIIIPSMGSPSGGFFGYSAATIATVSSTSTVPEPSTIALIAIAMILLSTGKATRRRT